MNEEQALNMVYQLYKQSSMLPDVHEQFKVALAVLKKAVEDAAKYASSSK